MPLNKLFQRPRPEQIEKIKIKDISWPDQYVNPSDIIRHENLDSKNKIERIRITAIIQEQKRALHSNIRFLHFLLDQELIEEVDRKMAKDVLRVNWERRWNLSLLPTFYAVRGFHEFWALTTGIVGYYIARSGAYLQRKSHFTSLLFIVLIICLLCNLAVSYQTGGVYHFHDRSPSPIDALNQEDAVEAAIPTLPTKEIIVDVKMKDATSAQVEVSGDDQEQEPDFETNPGLFLLYTLLIAKARDNKLSPNIPMIFGDLSTHMLVVHCIISNLRDRA